MLHYRRGCGVSQSLKKCGGIESRGVSSVQLCERLAVGGFCYPRDFPCLAKRRLNAVRLNPRRAYGFAVSTIARLRRAVLSRTASPIRTNVRARAKQPCCFTRKRRLCRRFAFFGFAEKKRRARALHYRRGCGVSQSLKKCGGIESRGVSSVQLCERLAVGGFCYPRDFPCLAKRRPNAVRLNPRRALPHSFSYSHKCARPRETTLLFRAKTAALPPFCFFSASPKKSGAHGRCTIVTAAAFRKA